MVLVNGRKQSTAKTQKRKWGEACMEAAYASGDVEGGMSCLLEHFKTEYILHHEKLELALKGLFGVPIVCFPLSSFKDPESNPHPIRTHNPHPHPR